MKKTLLLLLFNVITWVSIYAAHVDTTAIVRLNFPTLHIYTIDQEEPTCDYAFPPPGAFGIGTTNKNKVHGRAVLTKQKEVLFDSGDYEKDVSGITIKIRGNTSAYYYSKKGYKIKLQKKADMLCRGDDRFNDKDWALINDGDLALNTMIGLKVSQLMGLGWTPEYLYVNLIMNGEYRGIYMLIESVERNADCRLDVDKQTGYVFERDAYWWNEDKYFTTPMNKEFTFKYPDSDDLTDEQMEYLKNYMETFEQSIADGTYHHYIDLESFARWLLAHDILGTYDSGGSNIFLTKYDNTDTTRVHMATLWDFNSIMRTTDNWARVHHNYFYYEQLFNDPYTRFTQVYKDVWQKNASNVFEQLIQYLSDYAESKTAMYIDISRNFDHYRWNYTDNTTVRDNIDRAITWFNDRYEWLNAHIDTLWVYPTNIDVHRSTLNVQRSPIYDLNGRKMPTNRPLRPGIYIKNGRKSPSPRPPMGGSK